jgi:hypothetical protein
MLCKKVPSSRLIEVTELYMWRMAVEAWKNLQVCGRIVLVPYQEPGASKFAANFFFFLQKRTEFICPSKGRVRGNKKMSQGFVGGSE